MSRSHICLLEGLPTITSIVEGFGGAPSKLIFCGAKLEQDKQNRGNKMTWSFQHLLKLLLVIQNIFIYISCVQDDLIELVVLPQLGHISDDPDPRVRNMAVQLLVDVAQVCQTQRCQDILDIIKKVRFIIYLFVLHMGVGLFGKSILQVPDTWTSQYWWILEHF